jgi:hypothetical protein
LRCVRRGRRGLRGCDAAPGHQHQQQRASNTQGPCHPALIKGHAGIARHVSRGVASAVRLRSSEAKKHFSVTSKVGRVDFI